MPPPTVTNWRTIATAELQARLAEVRTELKVATDNAARLSPSGDVWALAERAAAGELRRVAKAIATELKRRQR